MEWCGWGIPQMPIPEVRSQAAQVAAMSRHRQLASTALASLIIALTAFGPPALADGGGGQNSNTGGGGIDSATGTGGAGGNSLGGGGGGGGGGAGATGGAG